ncbi:protein Niban 1-like [Thalassophryne amazonica]|uniref:protein Niban 1-like n=1 Tax=Thalassophryne amazonica TaxID=390379 RepID=UPI001471BC62|nr:protein Niban 1-like [Thalassophryne amazonica]
MGASSSGLLDEVKISHIKGIVDSSFQSFGVFYRQQYSAAYIAHLHQEVEPKKDGRSLLLTQRPCYAPEDVLYKGSVKFSCSYEPWKKCRERYTVLRRDYKVEIHENVEMFSRSCAAKLVLHPAGGTVLTTEEQSRVVLEQTCATILNGVKDDSSLVLSCPDVFPVYLHLPYSSNNCFLFQQEAERALFIAALKTCIRHYNLDPWRDSSYETQAYIRALRLYQQDRGCYEYWEKLLGTEDEVLACQVMEEVLPWLQSELQSKLKGKKTDRLRQWLAMVQAAYTLILEQLSVALEALRTECRHTASAQQAALRSNLDQIISSHSFLEEKVRACIYSEAEKVCAESAAPYMSSVLEVLTESISAEIQAMQHTLHAQMEAAFTHMQGSMGDTEKALGTLRSTTLDHCYSSVETLTDRLEELKQNFGLSSFQRLIQCARLEMEQLLDSAVYTLELCLESSARLQPSQIPVKVGRAKERVLKQLDHDSRLVQRRLYEEMLLEISLPAVTRRTDQTWKTELQQFEQYIFSDYSNFVLVQNVYDDVLKDILSKEIEKVIQEAAGKTNATLLYSSDLAISQHSLLGPTPPRSPPGSPAAHAHNSTSVVSGAAPVEDGSKPVPAVPEEEPDPKHDPSTTCNSNPSSEFLCPVIVIQPGEPTASAFEEDQTSSSTPPTSDEIGAADSPPVSEACGLIYPLTRADPCAQSDGLPTSFDDPTDLTTLENYSPSQTSSGPLPAITNLVSLKEVLSYDATPPPPTEQPTDTVHLRGVQEDCEVETTKGEEGAAEEADVKERTKEKKEAEDELQNNGPSACTSSGSPAEAANNLIPTTDMTESEGQKNTDTIGHIEETGLQSPQPITSQPESEALLPLDSVAQIRELVTEVIEVEETITHCPTMTN